MEQLKIAYICRFSTPQIRAHLKLKSLWMGNLMRTISGLPKQSYSDIGTWNADFIKAFEGRVDIDCHVILPHLGMVKSRHGFEINGIRFIALQEKEYLCRKVCRTLLQTTQKDNYEFFAHKIQKEINSIDPDVVVLCGAENPLYSYSVLLIHDKPVFVILQTWLNSPKRIAMGVGNETRRLIENAIFEHAGYFGTFEKDVVNYIKERNKKAVFFNIMFPSSTPSVLTGVDKKYDFTFFSSGLTKNKGIEDALIGLSYVKRRHKRVTLSVIGEAEPDYLNHLRELMEEIGVSENVIFHGRFQYKEDALSEVLKARVAVLPSITASLNSTVRETMFMKIPTIVYDNEVVEYINQNELNLLSAPIEDTMELGKQMLYAYEHPNELEVMAERARAYADKTFSVEAVGKALVTAITLVKDHYYNREINNNTILMESDYC